MHVERIERIFSELGGSPRGKKCVGMEGLVEEGNELLQEFVDPDVLDAGLVAAAQKVEHYEIASYGTVRTWAERLGYNSAAQLLQQTLDEEGDANKSSLRSQKAMSIWRLSSTKENAFFDTKVAMVTGGHSRIG